MESMKHKSGDTLEDARKKLIKKEKVDNFVLFKEKRGGKPVIVNYSEFKIKNGLLHVQAFGSSRKIQLEFKRGGDVQPYHLSYLERKDGITFVRNTIDFHDYIHPKPASLAQQAQHQAVKQTLQELSTAGQHIQPKDVSDTVELQELTI